MNVPPEALLLPFLFLASGFFSASETALFSLRREDLKWLRAHGTRSARCALELLERPRSLLVAVLFANLLVNFALMAVTARLSYELSRHGALGLVLGFLVSVVAVIVLGEVTPKSIALTVPRRVALLAAPWLLLFRNLSWPFISPLAQVVAWLLDLVERRLPPAAGALTESELKRFVELHGAEGSIEQEASEFLADALELGTRRVHEVMTPRVDLIAFDLDLGRAAFVEQVRERRVSKVPVYAAGGLDRIHGYVRTRDVLRHPLASLEELVRPIWYVPRTKSLESLLREMIERNEQVALVVGEYGGTDGLVTLEDVVEEITGDIAEEDAPPLVRPGPEGTWVLAGRFPLREAGELLEVRFEGGATTLSGFLAQRLGRLPERDDVVWHAGVQLRVAAMEGRRAREVVLAIPRPGLGRLRRPDDEVDEALTRSGAQRAHTRLRQWVAESEGPSEDPGDAS